MQTQAQQLQEIRRRNAKIVLRNLNADLVSQEPIS